MVSFPPEKPPKTPTWRPQTQFPGITQTEGFCGNSTESLDFPEFPGPSRFRDFGVPIFSVLGGNEVDMLGSAEKYHLQCVSALNSDKRYF